jgi:hypothetical protein
MMMILIATFIVLAVAWLSVWLYRNSLLQNEDDIIHLADGEASMIGKQVVMAHKLEVLDKTVTTLMVLTILAGIAVFGAWAYQVWMDGYKL